MAISPTNLIDRILKSPIGQGIIKEEAKERLEKRQTAAKELTRLQKQAETDLPKTAEAKAAALAEVEKAQAVLKVAQGQYQQAFYQHSSTSTKYDNLMDAQRRVCRENSPECIRQFIDDVRHFDPNTARSVAEGRVAPASIPDDATTEYGNRLRAEYSVKVRDMVLRVLEERKEAIATAEDLFYTGLTVEQIEAKIAELRAKLGAS